MTAERTAPAGTRPLSFLPVPQQDVPDASLRARLSELRALLVISLLMTESVDEDQILELAASSAPGLGPWRIVGYGFTDGRWRPGSNSAPVPSRLLRQLEELGSSSGQVELPGSAWACVYPLRSISGLLGHLVASAD